jgi:hypothetical protein
VREDFYLTLDTAKFGLSSQAIRAWLFFLRHETKYTKVFLTRLRIRNERATAAVTAPGGPVVSMTTYGKRIGAVHLALESIAAGSVLPSRLILWIDRAEMDLVQTPELQRLVRRGLEIQACENLGPHKKYYPYLLSTDVFQLPLATADDDMLYCDWWLAGLARSYREYPESVGCYRAHIVRLTDRSIAPYQTWRPCKTADPSPLHFATGGSGCIYPPSLLRNLKAEGSRFMQLCPNADDVWLHANALRAGNQVRQIWSQPMRFPFAPDTQGSGLYHSNVILARNDDQIRNTYSDREVDLLEAAIAQSQKL